MADDGRDTSNILITADLRKEEERRAAFAYVLTPITTLLDCRKIAVPKPFVNPHLLLDAILHCQIDLKEYPGPDEFKIGGRIGFWIARIKPFRALDLCHLYTNESIGLALALIISSEKHGPKAIFHKIQANLLYDLRYGTLTASIFSNQLQLLYCDEISKSG